MRRGREPAGADRLAEAEQRLHIYDALVLVLDHPHELCDLISASPGPEAAQRAIQAHFELDQIQAAAAMDAQFRRLDAQSRRWVREQRDAARDVVRELRAAEQ